MRTDATIGRGKLELYDIIVPIVHGWCPTDTAATRWASGLLGLPINREVLGVKALACPCLFVDITTRRAKQIHAILLLTVGQQFGIHLAHIDQMDVG